MPYFEGLLSDHPLYAILALAQGAFTIWMLLDCRRRGQDQTWFWVILWFQPLGAWAYFLLIKWGEWIGTGASGASSWLASLFHRPVSLEELRYQAENIPTLANRVALANRLIELDEYAEPVPLLEAALKAEPGYGQVTYSLALCHLRLGRPDLAIPLLEGLLGRDPRWRNYDGWRLLIEARTAKGDAAGALVSCRELVRYSPTLENHCLLVEHLRLAGKADEARQLLERSLRDYNFAPGPIRRRNHRWAREARRLQKDIGTGG